VYFPDSFTGMTIWMSFMSIQLALIEAVKSQLSEFACGSESEPIMRYLVYMQS